MTHTYNQDEEIKLRNFQHQGFEQQYSKHYTSSELFARPPTVILARPYLVQLKLKLYSGRTTGNQVHPSGIQGIFLREGDSCLCAYSELQHYRLKALNKKSQTNYRNWHKSI